MKPVERTGPAPRFPQAKETPEDSKVKEVGENAIPKAGFFGKLVRAGIGIGHSVLGGELAEREAEAKAFLSQHVEGIDSVITEFPQELNQLLKFLGTVGFSIKAEDLQGDTSTKKLFNSAIWIVMGNLAKQVVHDHNKITMEEFGYRAVQQLLPFLGSRLSAIDEAVHNGHAIDSKLFAPLVDELFSMYLPIEGKIVSFIKMPLTSLFAKQYGEIRKMIQGEKLPSGVDKTAIRPLLHQLLSFLTVSVSKRSSEDDLKKLVALTGETKIAVQSASQLLQGPLTLVMDKLVQDYLGDFLPQDPAMVKQATDAILKKVLLNAVEERARLSADGKVSMKSVIENLQNQVAAAYNGGENTLDQLAFGLVQSLVVNQEPFVQEFYQRYAQPIKNILKGYIKPVFAQVKAQREAAIQGKAQFEARVQNAGTLTPVIEKIGSLGATAAMNLLIHGEKPAHEGAAALYSALHAPIQDLIQGMSWRVLLKLLPVPPAGQTWKAEEVMPKILETLVNHADQHWPRIMAEIKKDWNTLSPEARKKKALQLVKPMVQDFMKQFITDDLAKDLPLPAEKQKDVAAVIIDKINEFAADAILASSSWLAEQKDNEEALDKMFNPEGSKQPSAPVKACHAAGKVIEAVLPYQCRKKQQEWSQKVSDSLMKALPQTEDSKKVADAGQMMVSSLLGYLGQAQSPSVKKLLGFVNTYAETALLKVVRQLTERVQRLDEAMEAKDLGTMEQILGLLLDEVKPHLDVYGRNRRLFRQADKNKMKESFRTEGRLHKAMDSEGDRDAVFAQWGAKLLSIAGVSGASALPIPEFAQNKVWDELQLTLLPSLLLTVFDKVRDPYMMDQLLGMVLQKMNTKWKEDKKLGQHAKELFFPGKSDDYLAKNPTVRQFNDPYQLEMEQKIGELGHVLLKMRRTPLLRAIFGMKSVRKMLGEAIGQPLRGNLRSPAAEGEEIGHAVPLNHVLGGAMDAFVNSIMPCEKQDGKWVYFYHDLKTGNVMADKHDHPDFTLLFPGNEAQEKIAESFDKARKKNLESDVKKGISRIVREQINIQVQTLVNAPWDHFVKGVVKVFRAISRAKHKDRVENWVKKILLGIRYYIVFPIMTALTLPLWLPVREIFSSILSGVGKRHVESLKNDIHVNLAYRVVDGLVQMMEKEMAKENPVS